MNINSYFLKLWSLLTAVRVYGEIERGPGITQRGYFNNNHRGRVLTVLMSRIDVSLEECMFLCIQHLQCKTVNYHSVKSICELTADDFDQRNADTISSGWWNYGTSKKVHGAWGAWTKEGTCSKTCEGWKVRMRDCDSPRPENGGHDCDGEGIKYVQCGRKCPVDGGWGSWTQIKACSQTCGGATRWHVRSCDSPHPQFGGKFCIGEKQRSVQCNTENCPPQGEWGRWVYASGCSTNWGSGEIIMKRECIVCSNSYCSAQNLTPLCEGLIYC